VFWAVSTGSCSTGGGVFGLAARQADGLFSTAWAGTGAGAATGVETAAA
jgi:hypothetical protein